MFPSRFGIEPRSPLRVLASPLALVLAVLAAGCSSANSQRASGPQWGVANQQSAAQTVSRKPDLEDDGMEAQPEPPRRQMVEPDDPSEPFSPNYGRSPGDPPAVRPSAPTPRPPQPGNGPPRVKAAAATPDARRPDGTRAVPGQLASVFSH